VPPSRTPYRREAPAHDPSKLWLAGPVLDLRPTTQAGYGSAVEQHLRRRYGNRKLDGMTADDLAALGAVGRIYKFAARRLGFSAMNPITLVLSTEPPPLLAFRKPSRRPDSNRGPLHYELLGTKFAARPVCGAVRHWRLHLTRGPVAAVEPSRRRGFPTATNTQAASPAAAPRSGLAPARESGRPELPAKRGARRSVSARPFLSSLNPLTHFSPRVRFISSGTQLRQRTRRRADRRRPR
jgi:hypothetical protein